MAKKYFSLVTCKSCHFQWQKRKDAISTWQGLCRPCTSKIISKLPKSPKSKNGEGKFSNRKVKKQTVSCYSCNLIYEKELHSIKEWKGLCRKCSTIEVANRPEIKTKKSIDAKAQLLRQGGIPNKPKIGFTKISGDKHYNWKGGITPINRKVRNSQALRTWKKEVFIKDKYACVICYSKNNLQADHIQPFSLYPELRSDINNGRTLCKPCHQEYGVRVKGNKIIKEASGFPLNYYTNFHLMA